MRLDEIRQRAESVLFETSVLDAAELAEDAEALARDVLDLCAEVERLRGDTLCPDCGIPEMWCRLVSTDPKRCWRWDDEKRRELEAEVERLRKIEEAEARWQNTRRHYFARLRVPLADPPADE